MGSLNELAAKIEADRAVFEGQSIAEVSPEEQIELQIMALRMVTHNSPVIHAQLDQHLQEAKSLAAEWLSEA